MGKMMMAKADKTETAAPVKLLKLPMAGQQGAPVMVVCDPPPHAPYEKNGSIITMYPKAREMFLRVARECGFNEKDFLFVCPCPPIPPEIETSDKRINDLITPYEGRLLDIIDEQKPRLIIYLGKYAGKLVTGRAVKITKARGSITYEKFDCGNIPVLPLYSPGHVLRRPENYDIFRTDFMMAQALRDSGYSAMKIRRQLAAGVNYEWVTDIQFLLDNPPKCVSLDTETTGLKWYTVGGKGGINILTVQICYKAGHVAVCPVDCDYYPDLTPKQRKKLVAQIKQLAENPKIRKTGHNIKYDTHMLREDLGIYVQGWACDTQILAFVVDENMQEKSLDECVRRWVPEMAGYNDAYNAKLDKSNMRAVSHDDMLAYGGGDADASFRLAANLMPLAKADKKQFRTFEKIIFPAIQNFCDPVELYGIKIDTKALKALQKELEVAEKETYTSLIKQVPGAIKRKHLTNAKTGKEKKGKDLEKALSFTRDAFVRDILFTKAGFGLIPKVFTPSTAKLKDSEKIPSVSTKSHLPFFNDIPFVGELTEYVKLQKIRSTYVGVPFDEEKQAPTGFWQYIHNGEIHPSFMLHRVVTGRTSSEGPNGQNFPKRGKLAKAYRKIFVSRPGYVFIETDLSQAELRIAAWMAQESTMLKIYKDGGDIHAMTAAHTMGLSLKQFMALDEEVIEQKRFQAKAINFGFLYGMWWRKFKTYAKTDYNLEFTDQQAQELREAFFDLYPGLNAWHESTRNWAEDKGYVRALHGALRRLPSVHSDEDYIKQEALRQAINAPVQRFASDLGLIAMNRLVRDADPEIIRPLMFVHDALVIETKAEVADKARGWVKFYMETPPLKEWFNLNPPLPIVADIAQGINLSEMEKHKKQVAKAPSWYRKDLDLAA